ncbi:MAG: endonuclease/exonuclease/phosphatase family protein [Chloroflexota bacterium]|nr:endonuclease/exonuclease/phosphatase family protein [Chloroflexota bacterium]
MRSVLRANAIIDMVFVALTFAVGVQLIRLFITGLVFYLREVRDFSAPSLGVIAFLAFGTVFLTPVVVRLWGPRRTLVGASAVMALARIAEQSVTVPQIDLMLSAVGVIAFMPVIPLAKSLIDTSTMQGGAHWRYGLLLGLALDTAVKGGLATVGASWQPGSWVGLIGLGLPIALLLLVQREALCTGGEDSPSAPTVRDALPLVALGPFLFLELLLFQNTAQLTALTDWHQPAVLAFIVGMNIAGLQAVAWLMRERVPWYAMGVAAVVLFTAVNGNWTGWQAAVAFLLGHLAAVTMVARSVGGGPLTQDRWGMRASWVAGVGVVAFLGLAFVYYTSYVMDLGVESRSLLGAAAVIMGVLAVIPQGRQGPVPEWNLWAALGPAVLLVAPLGLMATWSILNPEPARSLPLRFMTYNIHQGFGTDGTLDMEALARAIEAEGPDVIALHEVSRGWLVNGSVDTLEWLSQRLDMPYVWGPTADSTWGNAVLSRLPMTGVEHHEMPNNDDLLLDRGFLWIELDTGLGTRLRVIATHFHHVGDEGHLRLPQTVAILKRWNNEERTVLLGDFNARPGAQEVRAIVQAGFKDAFVETGAPGDGYTFASDDLYERIDYIFVTPDLGVRDYSARVSQASDHLPVAVTVIEAP